jgi:AAA15 family ATPase/GTPase
MLLQFSIKNFKTFKDKATLSLIASNYDKDTREDENIFINEKFGYRLLKSAVVYGANASGKSKLIEAFEFMRYFVINSSKESQKGENINIDPFRLSKETEKEPSEFEIIFIFNNELFRYGFEATKEKVVSEWLYHKHKTKKIELFYRNDNHFEVHERNFTKGAALTRAKLVRDNALLVSVAAQFNEEIAITILDWFDGLKPLFASEQYNYEGFTMNQTQDPLFKTKILELLKAADLGIQDIKPQELDIDRFSKEEMLEELRNAILKELKGRNTGFISDILTTHKTYDLNKQVLDNVAFSLKKDESSGTQKFFALAGPILDVLENGHTLIVDELDAKLHPNLVGKIVSLFNSKEINKKNAQLIFNTHDTNLLSSGLFRRDQIWFTDKDKYGASKLYSLADFSIRKTKSFEENYIKGKYGAVPYLGFFDNLNIPSLQ